MKRYLIVFATLGLLAAAACGDNGNDTGSGSEAVDHNDADVAFVQGMIPHHQQAITMSDLAQTTGNTDNAEVIDLAERIKAAQGPEIEQMENLLDTWGVEPEGGGHGEHGGEGGEGGHPGMLTEGEIVDLGAAKGAEFDRLFLAGMIEHHQGAVTSSETELEDGASESTQRLAREIIVTQEAEIAEMEELLTMG